MSLGDMEISQYGDESPLNQPAWQSQPQNPYLTAAAGNNYAPGMHRTYFQYPLRSSAAASSNVEGEYTGAGHSGYGAPGPSAGGYDYHPQTGPSGGYSHHSTGGTGYGTPPIVHPAPPLQSYAPSSGSKKKKKGSSALTALTLLSFFFFVNLLQNCLKDQMEAMNPTVMVLTADSVRNRFHKLAEMNSREQSTTSATSAGISSGVNIVLEPADLLTAAASSSNAQAVAASMITPSVSLHSPYSGVVHTAANTNGNLHIEPFNNNNYDNNNNNNNNKNKNNNKNNSNQNQNHNQQSTNPFSSGHRIPQTDFHDSVHSYPNHTLPDNPPSSYSSIFNDKYPHQYGQQQQQQQHYHHHHHSSHRPYRHHYQHSNAGTSNQPWSYDAGAASASSSAHATHSDYKYDEHPEGGYRPYSHNDGTSATNSWRWSSLPAHSGGSNYYADGDVDVDRYEDAFYTRIN